MKVICSQALTKSYLLAPAFVRYLTTNGEVSILHTVNIKK